MRAAAPSAALAAAMLLATVALATLLPSSAAAAPEPSTADGYKPLPYGFELHGEKLPILSGELPRWIAGHVYRNGPAYWPESPFPVHWLDGLAFLQGYHFHDGSVTFDGKFIGSLIYNITQHRNTEEATGDAAQPVDNRLSQQFVAQVARMQADEDMQAQQAGAAAANGSQPEAAASLGVRLEISLNTLVTIQEIDGHLLTTTATTASNEFDRETLGNVAMPYVFPDKVPFLLGTEHHRRGPDGALYSMAFNQLSFHPSYLLMRTAANTTAREVFGHLPNTYGLNYQHTFGVTKKYMVLADQPVPLPLIMTWKSFKLTPGVPVYWRVVSLATGEEVASFHSPGFFVFHQVNAYESVDEKGNPTIVVDLIAFPDCSVIAEMYMDTMRFNYSSLMPYWREAQPMRYVLPMSSPGVEVLGTPNGRTTIEMPTMNPAYEGLPYQFWYAMGASDNADTYNQVVKFDVVSGTSLAWSSEGCSPTEPLFIARPDAKSEDDGVLVSVTLDTNKHSSFLLVLNAKDLSEVARVGVPHMLPIGSHGIYSPPRPQDRQHMKMPEPSDFDMAFVADA